MMQKQNSAGRVITCTEQWFDVHSANADTNPLTWQGGPPTIRSTSPGSGSFSMSAADSASAAAKALAQAAQSSPWPALRMAACRCGKRMARHHVGLM
jgi:hypothetical protein